MGRDAKFRKDSVDAGDGGRDASLLRFDRDAHGPGEPSAREENLRSLFGTGRAPSNSRMREELSVSDVA